MRKHTSVLEGLAERRTYLSEYEVDVNEPIEEKKLTEEELKSIKGFRPKTFDKEAMRKLQKALAPLVKFFSMPSIVKRLPHKVDVKKYLILKGRDLYFDLKGSGLPQQMMYTLAPYLKDKGVSMSPSGKLHSLTLNESTEIIEVDEFGIELDAYEEPTMLEEGYREAEEGVYKKIKSALKLPKELNGYLNWGSTSLGGLFLTFRADGKLKDPFITAYSEGGFSIQFNVVDKYNQPYDDGNAIGYEVTYYNVPKLMSVKKPQDLNKVIQKVNNYLIKNRDTLVSLIKAKGKTGFEW